MTYLLDTNAWAMYLRQSHAGLVARPEQCEPRNVVLCSVVLGELVYGAERSEPTRRAANHELIADLCARFQSLPFDDAAAEHCGRRRAELASLGTPIGPNDLMIASIALAHGATLVTHNTREYRRITGLVLEDWQTP
ncbi:MAG TPA: type II toxin-antitoxin system VapC family toxin [Lacipirellulaceae bacterium]|nr:type II toxin-antitoxin system VapC family toxin [Lacipirellulaceae bacterium]